MFLIDEISLADDSVLERLNSVLEPERSIVLAEKGGVGVDGSQDSIDTIVAKDTFRLVSTMNPGGDFGKKEVWTKLDCCAWSQLRLLETLDICFGKSALTQQVFNLSPSNFQQLWVI